MDVRVFLLLLVSSSKENIYPMKKKALQSILFLDIETATNVPDFNALSDRMKFHWRRKADRLYYREEMSEDDYFDAFNDKAAIFAEFSKVICISCAIIDFKEDEPFFKVKSFYGDDEEELLRSFAALLQKYFHHPDRHYLCGHNIREFDIPVLCRRMTVNNISLPNLLNIGGKKPWQVEYLLDTLQMWKFGDYKSYISLDLLAAVLGVPSPKNELDGSQVSQHYWNENGLEQIMQYCQQDVIATAQVFLRLKNIDQIDHIKYIQ